MLTPYDEYPVHQASLPFSHIPSTDTNWDDGYWFAIFNPDEKIFLGVGARVNANTDMFGGYAFVNIAGVQRTVRVSRVWRPDFDTRIGPLGIRFVEPMKRITLTLDPNESGIAFDLLWEGTSPAYLEEHHTLEHRGRLITDQTRYSQAGKVSGTLTLGDKEWTLDPEQWTGGRDHSWGLYGEREPLKPAAHLLPPRRPSGVARALHIWTCFRTGPVSGFFHLNETADGEQLYMNDVHGTPFGGMIGLPGGETVELASGRQHVEYQPGTRIATRATVDLVDERGGAWMLDLTIASPPWFPSTIGYIQGSWKDGGTFHTYHGSEELAIEWDEFDFSNQPLVHKPYNVRDLGAHDSLNLGFDFDKPMIGIEYLTAAKLTGPDGMVHNGAAHFEHYVAGRYTPYGFE